jgi:hypothetical protein
MHRVCRGLWKVRGVWSIATTDRSTLSLARGEPCEILVAVDYCSPKALGV